MSLSQPQRTQILDVTLRDGSYLIHFNFTPKQAIDIALSLESAGVPYIEFGHGCGLGGKKKARLGLEREVRSFFFYSII